MRLLLALLLAACGNHDTAPAPAAGSGSSVAKAKGDAAIEAPPPVAMGSDGLPLVCGDWKAAIDKLQTCKALPENARASLLAVYTEASTGWGFLFVVVLLHLVAICRVGV